MKKTERTLAVMDEDKKRRLQELAEKQTEEQGITEEDDTKDDSYAYKDDHSDHYESSVETESSQSNDDTVINVDVNIGGTVVCPKCGSNRILFQRESAGDVGLAQNKVTEMPAKRTHGILWWCLVSWWWKPLYWIFIGWWYRPLFGGKRKGGWNLSGNKTINHTMAVCQNCGYSWKYKAKK